MKRLYRSTKDRRILGVCGGLAEYFEVDPTLVRLGVAVITVFTGFVPGIVLYILAAVLMPEESETRSES
ncbi:MAG TPA: PspC domain-containing protein [Firmicutes bacterium]|nr:PspC domain-containing protein [Candidatus Fermentithermobacillaceae bacterium]